MRQKHLYDLPAVFIPEYSDDNRCDKHGNVFDHNNAHLMKESENTIVFNEIGDQTFETVVMYRRTIGNCTCRQRYDGHQELLWHLGKGRFVNYCMLVNFLHNFVNCGLPIYAQFKSIQDNKKAFGITSQLTYDDLHRAVVGFFRNLEFDDNLAFSCSKHGVKPKWMVKILALPGSQYGHNLEIGSICNEEIVAGTGW